MPPKKLAVSEDIVYDLLKEVRDDLKSQREVVYKISADQSIMKERIEEIREDILEINKTDLRQTDDLHEHIRRTNLNEERIERIEERQEEIVLEVKDLYNAIIGAISGKSPSKVDRSKFFQFVIDNLKIIVPALLFLIGSILEWIGVIQLIKN